MPRLLQDSLAETRGRLDECLIRQKLREQILRDSVLDRIASLIGAGWFSLLAAENCVRLRRAPLHQRAEIAADNQTRLIRTYYQSQQMIEVHDAAETAEDHGLQPSDLKSRISGRRKRRTPKKGGVRRDEAHWFGPPW